MSAIRKAIGAAAEERAGKQIADGLLPAGPWAPVKPRGVAWRERGGSRGARAGTREVNHVTLVYAAAKANERVREVNALEKLRIDRRLSKELSRGSRPSAFRLRHILNTQLCYTKNSSFSEILILKSALY